MRYEEEKKKREDSEQYKHCEICGVNIKIEGFKKHERTKVHVENLEKKENTNEIQENKNEIKLCVICKKEGKFSKHNRKCNACCHKMRKEKTDDKERQCWYCNEIKPSCDFIKHGRCCLACRVKINSDNRKTNDHTVDCECGGQYTGEKNKIKHEKGDLHKFYLEHNMSKSQYKRQHIKCDCGEDVKKIDYREHLDSKIHLENLEKKKEE